MQIIRLLYKVRNYKYLMKVASLFCKVIIVNDTKTYQFKFLGPHAKILIIQSTILLK